MDDILRQLAEIRYERNDIDFSRNKFRVRGDTLEVYPAYWAGRAIRVEFFGDEIDRITEVDPLTGKAHAALNHVAIFPASHYVIPQEKINKACEAIEQECMERMDQRRNHDVPFQCLLRGLYQQRLFERSNR